MGGAAFLSLLLITTSMAYSSTAVAEATAKSRDATAIADFTKHLSNPPPSWVHGGDVCSGTFVGITCNGHGRVTGINLTDQGLSGTLTSFVSTLGALEVLELAGNNLTGAIPPLDGMTSLTRLVLSGNGFTSVPYDFFSGLPSLVFLGMDNLPLNPWLLPDAIGDCRKLQIFSAANVSIIGSLPGTLANLKSLIMLWLSYNYLRGSLPPWLAELSSLEILGLDNQMSDVKLSGKIDIFASFKNMKELWIQSNHFSGPIPDFNNSQLQLLNVSDNMLTGLVPTSLMRLESLQDVGLSNNLLQGPWPVFKTGVTVYMGSGNRFCLPNPGPCDRRVSILLEVESGFGFPLQLSQTWAGNDPCNGSWVGITCNGSVVVEINLSSQNLSGIISPAFADLSMLERLDLSNNQLKGAVPVALTNLRNLKFLNISKNDLSYPIPRFNPSVEVVTDLMDSNSQGSGNAKSKMLMIWIIVGGILLLAVPVLLACLCMCYLKKKKDDASEPALPTHLSTQMTTGTTRSRHSVSSTDSGSHTVSSVQKLPMEVLKDATNDFDNSLIIGTGGSGVVFLGTLDDGTSVAIKRFNSAAMDAEQVKQFKFEINDLGKWNHCNVVNLLAYCVHNTEWFLVYEYMSGGTLRERLQPGHRAPLTWMQRMRISLDVAHGIEYLHGMSHKKFIHRDLKPSNILLDEELKAKVSDFGLVRAAEDKSSTSKTAGTYGYLAPEYAVYGTLGTQIDVYAYGIILMEIITGRKAIDESLPQDKKILEPIFRAHANDIEKMRNIVDPTLELNDEELENLMEVTRFACSCTAEDPNVRPTMQDCVRLFSGIVGTYKPIVIGSDKGEIMGLNERMQDWAKDIPTTSGTDKDEICED
ncbi:unnamed protein product [Urochloa humidicola]